MCLTAESLLFPENYYQFMNCEPLEVKDITKFGIIKDKEGKNDILSDHFANFTEELSNMLTFIN